MVTTCTAGDCTVGCSGAVSALQMQIFLMTVFATARIHLPNQQEKRFHIRIELKLHLKPGIIFALVISK